MTISKNGSWICFPKKRRSNEGVRKIPARLLNTALQSATATLPSAADVSITHMLIVVGRHVRIIKPSSNGPVNRFGKYVPMNAVNGRPNSRGHTANVVRSTDPFNLILEAALLSSASSKERPDSRNMHATPKFPIKSSARKRPPFFPNYKQRIFAQMSA